MSPARYSAAAAFVAISTMSLQGLAQAGASATAESLFREGKDLMAQQRYAEACVKFEGSFVLEETLGTLLNLANCHQHEGRTASAWAEFLRANAMARRNGQEEREQVARERAQQLEPNLMRLSIEVPPETHVEGLEVRRDEVEVEVAAWGSAIPADPGRHTIRVSAPGKKATTHEVELVEEGATVLFEVPPLEDDAPAPAVVAQEPPPNPVPAESAPPPAPSVSFDAETGSSQRTLGMVLGSVGVAGMAAGTVFGALARSEWGDAEAEGCVDGICPTRPGQRAAEDAKSFADYGTIGVAGGGALLVAGVVLYLTSPTASERVADAGALSVDAGPHRGGAFIRVGGGF